MISAHDVTNKVLLRDSIYNADMVISPNSGNSNVSMREVIITSVL